MIDYNKINYDQYRKHVEELAFEKGKLNKYIIERKQKHQEYRAAFKEYNNYCKKVDEQTKRLMELIPNPI